MTEVEDLLRRTFTDRERDLDGAAPSLAGVRERSRQRRRRQAAVLAGAATVTAVLVGSTLALTAGPQQAATVPSPTAASTGDDPISPAGGLPPFRKAPITSADGRTSAVIRWAPTWLPDGIGEPGRLVSNAQQVRTYGRTGQGPTVRVMSTFEGCGVPREMDGEGEPRDPGVAAVVAGTPARLWSFRRAPELGMQTYLPASTDPGHLVCVPVAGGGLWTIVTGTADTAGDALRVAGSVRSADPAEVAVRISLARPVGAVTVRADGSGTGRWTGVLAASTAYVELGPPDPDGPPPNTTVDGRPAHLTSSAGTGAVLTMPLGSDLEAVFTAQWPDITVAENRDYALTAARGLQVGATPDYSWLSR